MQANIRTLSLFLPLVLIILSITSCVVPKKQFDQLLAEKVTMEGQLNDLQQKKELLQTSIDSLQHQLDTTTINKAQLEAKLERAEKDMDDLQAEHDKLQTYYNNALNNSGKLNRDIAEQHEQLMALQATLKQAKYENDQLADSLSDREAKVMDLEKVIAKSQQSVTDLKNKVKQALTSFGKKDLSIVEKNGKVYVSLSEQLLFKSGSAVVDPKGQRALRQLASALRDGSASTHVMVEGHTDNVPISKKSAFMKDNWDLSVMRATSIVRILVNEGVNPAILTAAGRGKFFPVAPNDTNANKQQNRRTEIILTPDLTHLFEILGQGK